MKKLIPLFTIIFFISCSQDMKEVDYSKIVSRNDLAYEVNSEEPFSGLMTAYHPNGQLRSRVQLKNGLRNGLHEYFLENGQLLTRDSYKNGQREGLSEEYFLDGQLKSHDCWQQGKAVSISYCKK